METIKKSPNVEFEVIYADGERRRVQEGVLLGVEEDGSITMHNGTDCAAVWFAAADGMLVAIDACNALPAFTRNRMQDPVSLEALKTLAVEVNRRLGKSDEATFRLGQMDMKESIADMLEGVSKGTSGFLLSDALIHAAALVRSMKVPEGRIEE
jgi:hypothetical protein